MKKRCAGLAVVLVLLVAFGIGRAQTTFHGVLNPNNRGTVIDSVTVAPPDTTFRTAGWSATGTTYDTFDFPDLAQWPTDIWVFGVVNAAPQTLHIPTPEGERWYALGLGTVTPFVMFYGSGGGAIEESRPAEPLQRLNVSPSVVTGQMTVRLQPAAPGRSVVEIHDAVGNVVRSLTCTAGPNGLAVTTWNREDGLGHLVPEGVYFCRYAASGVVAVRKVLVTN
jgi:hypothetical protein